MVVFNGHIIPNHGFVLLDNIGEGSEALLCLTDLPACCRPPYTDPMGRQALGNWYFLMELELSTVVSSGTFTEPEDEWLYSYTAGEVEQLGSTAVAYLDKIKT